LIIDPQLSADFSLEELNTALLKIKPGKAAGFDGVYPELIKKYGRRTEAWIVSFFNDILTKGRISKLFKQALNLEKMVQMPHTSSQILCSVSFSNYLHV
jgi:hypothetical protein